MEISLETLRNTKGIGSKTLERIIEQHEIDNNIKSYKSQYIPSEEYRINEDINLWQGDCLKLMEHIPDKSIDLVIIDPPYKTTSRGSAGNSGGMLQKDINKKGQVFRYNDIASEEYAKHLWRVLKEGSHCYVMTNHKNLYDMITSFTVNGFHFIKSLIWNKGNKIMGQFYMSQYEYILFFRKGRGIRINNCGTSDILCVKNKKTKNADGQNIHDTEKPVALIEILINNSSNKGDIVLDCFMGSGSTGVACKNLNRKFIGIELDEEYFNISKERING